MIRPSTSSFGPRVRFGLLVLWIATGLATADDSVPHNQDAPPGPALSPAEAIAKMRVPEGFRVELVASEPDLINPVAMTFDERGRIWVTESLEYPRLEAGPGRDRVKILEDRDGDGTAEHVTIFAEGLNIPSGIAVGHGGVWVANSPDLLLLRDTDGDDRADEREIVITGFGREDVHELPSALAWGPDGWLYGLNGVFNESVIRHQGREHAFTCALWRLQPRDRRFELFAEGTSNPWGLAFDGMGSAFVSACVIDHLWHLVETGYYHRQGGPYPRFTWKIESIVDHAHQKAAYCGLAYYDAAAYPKAYRGRLFMGNIHGNCINVDRLERRGSTYIAHGETDFLTANDAWFMPVVQKVGPDGCLYILDWYDRYHCYQDARRDPEGIDRGRGRLYRVRYKDAPRAPRFDLSGESDESLVSRLGSDNVYFRETAQRVLSERGIGSSTLRLESLTLNTRQPALARRHALWARLGQGPPDDAFHQRLLTADDDVLRAFAVRATGQQPVSPAVKQRVLDLACDESSDVRLQVVIVAPRLHGVAALDTLVGMLNQSHDDPLYSHVIWQNLHPLLETQGARLVERLRASSPLVISAWHEVLPRICERLLASQPRQFAAAADVSAIALETNCNPAGCLAQLNLALDRPLNRSQQDPLQSKLGRHLVATLRRTENDALTLEAARLAQRLAMDDGHRRLDALAQDEDTEWPIRRAAIRALVAEIPSRVTWIDEQLLEASEPLKQRDLLDVLGTTDSAHVARLVIDSYPRLAPDVQPAAIELLTGRVAWSRALLDAVAEKRIAAEAITPNQVRKLQASPDAELAAHVARTWGTVRAERDPAREQVVQRMTEALRSRPGDAARGEKVFAKICASCHRVGTAGNDLGPDISRSGQGSFEQLISNVFDPSLVVGAAYQARTLVTADGLVLLGILIEDSAERVVLKLAGGQIQAVPRDQIDELAVSQLSLMPEGLETQFTLDELSDLLAYLSSAAKSTVPQPPTNSP